MPRSTTLDATKTDAKTDAKTDGKTAAAERLKFRKANHLPTTAVECAQIVGGALVFNDSPLSSLLCASKPDAKGAVEFNAAVAVLPPFVGAFVRQWVAYVQNRETGLASVRDLTIGDGFGLMSGRNPEQIVIDRMSARASKGDVRKIAVQMVAAK